MQKIMHTHKEDIFSFIFESEISKTSKVMTKYFNGAFDCYF